MKSNDKRRAEYRRQYWNNHEYRIAHLAKMNRARLLLVLRHYSAEEPFCACCGEKHLEFLCIDHVNGGGSQHRKQMGVGKAIYPWLIRNNFPDGFQVLCHNCNMAKGFYGNCPHKMV